MYCFKLFGKLRFFTRVVIQRHSSKQCVFIEHLKARTVLKLSGPDTTNYLQSMITNDMKDNKDLPSLYALLLNSQGKVLYDILLYKLLENEFMIEYDSTAVDYLHKHLFMYRLRKNVEIKPLTDILTWVIYPEFEKNSIGLIIESDAVIDTLSKINGVIKCIKDPRNDSLGIRVLTSAGIDLRQILHHDLFLQPMPGKSYRRLRYKLGIGEGVLDHPPGNCLPLETNVDFLSGISFSKGCYIGQELAAKSHFVLTIRKRLMPVILQSMDSYPSFLPECPIINEKQQKIGRLRSHSEQHGLAVLKYEGCSKFKSLILKDYNIKLEPVIPSWWPVEIRNKI